MSTPPNDPHPGQDLPPRDNAGAQQPSVGQNPTDGQPAPYGYQNAQPSGYSYPGNMSQVSVTEKGPAPKEVERAFWLIIAAGVLNFLASILSVMTTPVSGAGAGVATALVLVFATVLTGVYILLAIFIRKGHNWARITATVLAALSVLSYLFGLLSASMLEGNEMLQGQELMTPGPLETVLTIIVTLLGVAGVVMTFLKPARPYFQKQIVPGQF
ncbi:hypothetical protein [Arthrobacter sp. CAL618]|uniref:hypothetical protein n=1 Tax=Arthrobacter sp. CAL618 TaxID=1055770 RepID=UPI000405398C|nr:hypothetical protein [Arthrobacter sp. CAL618]